MITIHPADTVAYANNGYGNLSDCVKAKVIEEVNGSYELELLYPTWGRYFEHILLRNIIFVKPNPFDAPQPFRIYGISKPINKLVTVNAAHISYDMSGYPVSEFKATSPSDAFNKLKANSIVSCPFTFNSTYSSTGEVNVEAPRSMRSVLGNNILKAFGGEYEFDGTLVRHIEKRGANRGVKIRYGKNLTDIRQDENMSNVYTAIYPYWIGYTEDNKKVVVKLPEKTIAVEGKFDFQQILPIDAGENFTEKPSEEQLREYAKKYIKKNKIGIPTVEIEASFVELLKSAEYEELYSDLEEVKLGDTLEIEFPEAGIMASARCIKSTYDVILDRYESLELGDAKSTLATTIAGNNQIIHDKIEENKKHFDAVVGNIRIEVADIGILVADKANIKDLEATNIKVENLEAKKADIEDLEATNASVGNLVAEVANINKLIVNKADTEDLNATNAEIVNLKAEVAEIGTIIVDKADIADLEALNGKFTNLQAKVAVIDEALIGKADIGDLNAINATIETLTAKTADIEQLVNGNLTSDNIHSLHLTANKVTVEDAFIKNAMIDSMDINKLVAEYISTNKFKIKSDDGGVEIVGSTQQFLDKQGRIRIQMGKDAKGDFTFMIVGEDGESVLIDSTGIKQAAIADDTIVGDMIAGESVGEKQIDYSSFSKGFNADTNSSTINSSKVMVDGTGQTLTVAFGSLTTTVNKVVKSVDVLYYLSTSKEEPTGGEWISQAPDWVEGKYIWTKTKTTYVDGSIQESDPSCMTGATGEQGVQGDPGRGIKSIQEQYYLSSSAIELVGGSWSNSPPQWQSGKFIWTRSLITYTDEVTTTTDPICVTGHKGDPGQDGADAEPNFTWIRYADDAEGNGISDNPTNKEYIGFAYNKRSPFESDNPEDYSWSLIKGADGPPGLDGQNGVTLYTWIKYSPNPNGEPCFNEPDEYTEYIGIAVNKIIQDPSTDARDYTWSRFKGDIGVPGNPGPQGPPGESGQTLYTWIKYADDVNGNGLSDDPDGKRYIGIAHNKEIPIESHNPKDYTWSLFKGTDGVPGAPGPQGTPGIPGKTYYTWVKYSDYEDGFDCYDIPYAGTKYIGIATNKTTPEESDIPEEYVWSKFRGEDGVAGADGKTYYTWIKYADDENGTGISDDPNRKEYIGFAYNKDTINESNDPKDYTWSKIKGENGVQGPVGADGQTFYTWIKYSDNSDGNPCYDEPKSSTLYIGIATNKLTPTESSNHQDYKWSKFRGDDGVDGTDGRTYYTWIRYADDAYGNGISDDPFGKSYIGFSYNKLSPIESDIPEEYTWSLIKGTDGIPGQNGEDGQTFYTWIKYSDNSDGNPCYDVPTDNTKYIGIAVNQTSPVESSDYQDYTWSKFRGSDGKPGVDGRPGVDGQDGKTYYTWIKYADDNKGNGMSDNPEDKRYIGFAYNKETSIESTNKEDYSWSLIKGTDGVDGAPGVPGQTYYTWIKYSNYEDGFDCYDIPYAETKYIGIAVNKNTPIESDIPEEYIWSKFRGDDGVNGEPGEDGKTYYTWIKYANDIMGNGMSDDPNGKAYIGFAYNKPSAIESNTPGDYAWSLIKGTDGVPGQNGADGKTFYTWIKYSDNSDGNPCYDVPKESTKYIGIAVNKDAPFESPNYQDYIWSKFRGEDGIDGQDGVPGTPGEDGKTYYTWIRYADDRFGNGMSDNPDNKMYIGFAYNKDSPIESSIKEDYSWSLIKGDDGIDGAPGQTFYTWIKYSDYEDGFDCYDIPYAGTKYIGIATNKTTPEESDIPEEYIWSKFRGEDGTDGVPGKPGIDGKTYYTWIKYANNANGDGITDDPTNKPYIGFAYNKETPSESNNPKDYTWSLIKGTDGIPGQNGQDGQTFYTWIKYSDNSDGNPCYDVPQESTKYIGIATNQLSPFESPNYQDYIWSKFRGDDGVNGQDGRPGADGRPGVDGVGVRSIIDQFAISSSKITPPLESQWKDSPPEWSKGYYMWTRSKITYTDDRVETTKPQCDTSWEAVNAVEETVNAQNTKLEVHQGKIEQLITNTTITKSDGKIVQLKDAYNDTVNTVESMKSTIGQHTTEINKFTGQVSTVSSKLNEVERDLEGTKSTVSSHTTQITGLNKTVESHSATIQQLDDEIKLKVERSEVTTIAKDEVDKAIDGIQFGVRNLILDTKEMKWNKYVTEELYNGLNIAKGEASSSVVDIFSTMTAESVESDKYTVSFYAKSSYSRDIDCCFSDPNTVIKAESSTGQTSYVDDGTVSVTIGSEWKRYHVTWTQNKPSSATAKRVVVGRIYYGDLQICGVTLVEGEKPSDWMPSPKDVDNDLLDVESELIKSYTAAITASEEGIKTEVFEQFTSKDEFGDFIEGSFSRVESKVDGVTTTVGSVQTRVEEVDGEIKQYQEMVSSYMRFTENGLEIGKSNSTFMTRIDNEKLAFLQDEQEIAYINNHKMFITDTEIQNKLTLGAKDRGFYEFVPRENGNLSIRWRES